MCTTSKMIYKLIIIFLYFTLAISLHELLKPFVFKIIYYEISWTGGRVDASIDGWMGI